jgi:copper chaperone
MSIETANLKTTGMHCPSCSMLIDMTLDDIDGVIESKSDHASGVTVVSYDDDKTGVDAIVDAIRGVGYDAEPNA